MTMLSEKYTAGFLDADGTIYLQFPKHSKFPQMVVGFSQKGESCEVLTRIKEVFGGSMRVHYIKGKPYSNLTLCGGTARKCLGRIKKYLVVKRHYAETCIEMANKRYDNLDDIKQYLKVERRVKSLPLPNYPSRKWLAGYFDGDGCLSVARITGLGMANIVAHIASSDYDTEGIELIAKGFGGKIYDMCQGRCKQWKLHLPPSKATQFLSYFAKHSVVKRDQLLFTIMCAEMKHYRDGNNIKSALKHMKAQEQRLSDSEVASLFQSVRDLERQKRTDYGDFVHNEKGWIIGKRLAA